MTINKGLLVLSITAVLIVLSVGVLIHVHRQNLSDSSSIEGNFSSSGKELTTLADAGKRFERSVTVDGLKRNYTLFMPRTQTNDGSPHPVLFAFHPATAAGTFMEENAPFHVASGTESFVVVYPEGYGRTFNTGECCGAAHEKGVDDVAFFKAMMADAAKVISIRPKAYVTGFSNGSFMTYRLICDVPQLIAAAVPFAGAIEMDNCVSGYEIPILHINGDKDIFTMTGKSSSQTPQFLNAVEAIVPPYTALEQIAVRNGCTSTHAPTTGLPAIDASCEAYASCPAVAPVTMCTIPNLGHAWPGSGQNVVDGSSQNKLAGKMGPYRPELDSTGPIVEFFLKH